MWAPFLFLMPFLWVPVTPEWMAGGGGVISFVRHVILENAYIDEMHSN